MSKGASRALCCFVLALAVGGAQGAARPTERSKQKAAAEASRAGIQQKLQALKKDISRTESEKENAADTLAESEEAISDANRALRELAGEQQDTNAKLRQLDAEREKLAATIDAQKQQLTRLLRQHYVAGNEDRIKLLLSGDNPNRINRDLQLMAYLSQAQARLLASLRGNLAAVETNREQAQNAKDELEEIAEEQTQQKAVLEKEKAKRKALLGSLSQQLAAQRKEAGNLARDEQRMSALVDNLSKLIRQQAEAAAAEQRRLAAVAAAKAKAEAEAKALADARRKAERERLAKEHPGTKPVFKPDPIDADEPPKVAAKPAEVKPDPAAAKPADIALAPAAPEGAFASLKGQMRSPVAGKLAARFGAKRGEASWKGVFIQAAEGADVRAVAAGRVVFAKWMRGFGNLIIVDHGSQYLSIYGNNQALLKREGETVKGGDPIASAGNTGGREESGLYFELRHLGQAFDPAGWIKF
ncbi:peptidoglycan DD-metalloendopeptidase family protein [Massilia sp. R2A-15]|uniref:murein hydrolase activator EnvC family protein n=1 Tax=Massilia sp. R2A-15 TaxID=3064278 RepID=UPI002732F98D|nr:peptidoglycan DD-metalloendopeptidase family protein [Massilia sp. R2A-15]WLI89262.1 peptidoglycan DD-metalloendopeptidase family protein [Massilia sp. R2A-15]